MSVPSSHILPSSAFRHIGIMVLFMSLMTAFCAMGFVSVKDITSEWIIDIKNTLNIEITPYDTHTKTVFTTQKINQNLKTIEKLLKNDPIIRDIKIVRPENILLNNQEDFEIPAPIFITLYLHPERADNAESRLVNNIKQKVPQVIIKSIDDWERDITRTASILQIVFGGLALSVFIVTSIILSGVVKSQINASRTTIELIHLMGASTGIIAGLFKSSVSKPTLWGVLVGLAIAFCSLSPLMSLLGLNEHVIEFYYYLFGIFILFVILTRMITHITVLSALKKLP